MRCAARPRHIVPPDWQLDGTGLAEFVDRLPRVLQRLLGPTARLPRTVFTDRGTGMYSPLGAIVHSYEAAVRRNGFRTFWGADASLQSPDMPDILLHETAVAMFRKRMRAERPAVLPWMETTAQWAERASRVVQWMNAECELGALCKGFPGRLEGVIKSDGERLRK